MRCIAVIGLTVTLLASAATAATDDGRGCRLRVGWEPYPPYTFSEPGGGVSGADIDLVDAIGAEIGCSIEYIELPWARILREIELGSLDVSTSTSLTPERIAWASFSEPYRLTEMAIYVRAGEADDHALSELADVGRTPFRLGVIVDYFYGPEFIALSNDPKFKSSIDGATDYRTNILKLINGRIDGYLAEDVRVMDTELRRLGFADQVERHPLAIDGERLRLMFSRKTVSEDTVAAVNAAIERLRVDGQLQAILRKYAR